MGNNLAKAAGGGNSAKNERESRPRIPTARARGSTVSAETVADAVRHAIQSSEIMPGEWLRESRLCSEHSAGRTAVRKALRILADDGLVKIEENRGARVSATTVEEVFDLYELRAALYGVAVRFACMRATDEQIGTMVAAIDRMLADAEAGVASEQIIEQSEKIFGSMIAMGSIDAQKMIEAIRRKTRFHFSYTALALNQDSARPFSFWKEIRKALVDRDADAASQGARNILYFMQGEVARMMLSHGARMRHIAYAQTRQGTK
jgi:DNA-binding GntR family transcriptional regulator